MAQRPPAHDHAVRQRPPHTHVQLRMPRSHRPRLLRPHLAMRSRVCCRCASRSWGSPKAARLLAALQLKRISRKRALLEVWDSEPTYLLAEVLLWVRKEQHTAVREAWPLRREVAEGSGAKRRRPLPRAEHEDHGTEYASGSDSEGGAA
jgi:hypothetical protein